MSRRIVVDTGPLARVEGEGSLVIEGDAGRVVDVRLNIFEPPRYYEAFLQGRKVEEVVDIVSRICGICPVAYQVSALNALEGLFEIEVDEQVRRLRRLIYLGEWIESHALHIFMLAAPDYLRVPDVLALAKAQPELVAKALSLKRLGNDLMVAIGGREIHPVSLKIGGIYKAPARETLAGVASKVDSLMAFAEEAVRFSASLEAPELMRDVTLVCLRDPERYAIAGGEVISNRGLRIGAREFEEHFFEHQAEYSNALRSLTKDGGPYMVGPLARVNLNFAQLRPRAKALAEEVGFKPPVTDPFKSIVARAVELVHALEEVKEELSLYSKPAHPHASYEYREGTGFGVSEAPRGILYHSYQVNRRGFVEKAKIVPPTAQNQVRIEEDVRELAPRILEATPEEARRISEMAVRNYDPCISCATHFLKLKIRRG
ncbi:MAG TPA: Ni/Fe hydrogenase subunit alpha [Conexivisphaerales archaeon]|nr:Ni/Fe hydrogenase subunit alpha [Conexivisphaerales archaeon]